MKEAMLDTYFAPPERAEEAEIRQKVEAVSVNPVMNALLVNIGGLVAILNDKRQILAVNDSLLDALKIQEGKALFGLRLGEAAGCCHASEMPGGCGTSRYCSTCGAVIAMVTALMRKTPMEKQCCLEISQDGTKQELFFNVRACPVRMEDTDLILVILQDISSEQRWAALERVFHHDINNVLMALHGNSELLARMLETNEDTRSIAERVLNISRRLADEIGLQRLLLNEKDKEFLSQTQVTSFQRVCDSLRDLFVSNPISSGKTLNIDNQLGSQSVACNPSLLLRILTNMLTNAFEATDLGGAIQLTVSHKGNEACFSVWNAQVIPEDVALRIFQRNFSTKAEIGRGLGTFSMKLFGEEILGGKVSFESKEGIGTTFHFFLPEST